MIYFTQLIYIIPGKEADFHAFEQIALPAMARYGGRLLMRLRPGRTAFIEGESEAPYEVHLVSFDDEQGFLAFGKDQDRQQALHLKEASVSRSVLIRGQAL
jgi:uncharacterized protein (DUF1330 family)